MSHNTFSPHIPSIRPTARPLGYLARGVIPFLEDM